MKIGGMNAKVDFFFTNNSKWQKEYEQLRKIVLDCGLTEELKWGCPCYTLQKKNVVLIHGFKEYCALLFMKGALLKDTHGILIQQTENVQSARQIRFTGVKEIVELAPVLKGYINAAAAVEKAGLKVTLKQTAEYTMPAEFKKKLDGNRALKTAFEELTPGRQRQYLFYFSQAKQAETREARIEKCVPQIMHGLGLND